MLSFLCRHDFYWSERHRADRCRRCGHVRASEGTGPTQVGSLAALLAADDGGDPETRSSPPTGDSLLEDWDRIDAAQPVMPPQYAFEPKVQPETEPAPAPKAKPKPKSQPAPSVRNGGSTLLNRLEHLASGGALSRDEAIETLLALIEDGQSSDPVVFGPTAATWYARLHNGRQNSGA